MLLQAHKVKHEDFALNFFLEGLLLILEYLSSEPLSPRIGKMEQMLKFVILLFLFLTTIFVIGSAIYHQVLFQLPTALS